MSIASRVNDIAKLMAMGGFNSPSDYEKQLIIDCFTFFKTRHISEEELYNLIIVIIDYCKSRNELLWGYLFNYINKSKLAKKINFSFKKSIDVRKVKSSIDDVNAKWQELNDRVPKYNDLRAIKLNGGN